jgi:hypothetical protein
MKNGVWVVVVLFLFSCRMAEKEKSQAPVKLVEAKGKTLPVERVQPPTIISLDSVPKPRIVEIPKVEKIKASFFYVMPNFTTEQGLGLDSSFWGMQDKVGNRLRPILRRRDCYLGMKYRR